MTSNNHLTLASWTIVPVAAFALGWNLKPDNLTTPEPNPPELEAVRRGPVSALGSPTKSRAAQPDTPASSYSDAEAQFELDFAGSGAPLTSAQIQEIGSRFKAELDPVQRRVAFLKMLDGMTAENAKEIREQIAHLPADSPAFRDFHYAWGKIGGAEAVLHGAETQKPDMIATFAGWTSEDPKAARQWYDSLEPSNRENYANQEYMKMGMVHGLSNIDSGLATEFVMERARAGDRAAGHMIGIVANKMMLTQGTETAADWAKNLPPGEVRGSALGRVAQNYAQSDPEAAADWARSVAEDPHARQAVGAVSRQLAYRDPVVAIEWVESLGDSPHRASGYYSTFESWAGKDPNAASQHLLGMQPSADRDHAIGGLVSRHRWEDPVAAIAWSAEIGDVRARENSIVRAGQAYLRRDAAAAREWLQRSSLSAEARKRITTGRH